MHTEVQVPFLHASSRKTKQNAYLYVHIYSQDFTKDQRTNMIKVAKPFSYMITMRACMYVRMNCGALSDDGPIKFVCWQDEKCLTEGKLVWVF